MTDAASSIKWVTTDPGALLIAAQEPADIAEEVSI